jgi:hypothetical protein
MTVRLKALLGLTAVGLFASALIPPAAQAQGTGKNPNFKFCNVSSADKYVMFPVRGRLTSTITNPGHCWTIRLDGERHDVVLGFRLTDGRWKQTKNRLKFNDSDESIEFDF